MRKGHVSYSRTQGLLLRHGTRSLCTLLLSLEFGELPAFRSVAGKIHDLGVVIERVREFFRVRPVAVSEARVIRRDQVIAIGKPGEEWLEHSRRRGQSVEQENGWGI